MLSKMPSQSKLCLVIAMISSLLSGCAVNKYETPAYRVVKSDGPFEIRVYPKITIVSLPMRNHGSDGAFMKLFGYISGQNVASEKIPMTVPVIMSGGSPRMMSFILPKDVVQNGVPAPFNHDLMISNLPVGSYAAYRFAGSTSPSNGDQAALVLRGWTDRNTLTVTGSPLFAYYNPPWTPGFMRRNEVLLRLVPEK